jgi:hypothetical protein
MPHTISLFTPINYGTWPTSKTAKLREFVDAVCSFGEYEAVLLSPSTQRVEIKPIASSKTALKIVAWMLCFIAALWNPLLWAVPATLLALKIALRRNCSFHVAAIDPLKIQRNIEIRSPGNFQTLRNQKEKSDVTIHSFDAPSEPIYAHSHLLPEYFKTRVSSPMRNFGLDEKETEGLVDLSKMPFATAQNIHLLLDYQYGCGIKQKLSLEELLNLFNLADFVLAHDLKKEILQLLLITPEYREDLRLAPVFRNMLLSPQLSEEEFERLYEWSNECTFSAMKKEIINKEVELLAEKGESRAQLLLAFNSGAKERHYSALLADKNHPLAQMLLASDLITEDPAQALQLVQKSAKSGCAIAIGYLSCKYFEGSLGLSQDVPKALELAEQSSEKGSLLGVFSLGRICTGLNQAKFRDSPKAFEFLQKAAQMGYRYAEYCLGVCYEKGIGTRIDRPRALEFYMKAKTSIEKHNDQSLDQILTAAIQRVIV